MTEKNLTLSPQDKLALIGNLYTLLSSGVPILEAIDSLLEDAKGNMKRLLTVLKKDLIEGKHIYITLARFPKIFNKVTVNLLKSGEEAGTLDTTLKDLKDNIKRDMEFTDKIKSALTYPIIILFVFVGVLMMILTVVVPRISSVFLRLRIDLPLPTRILIFTSNLLINNTFLFLGGATIVVIAFIFIFKTNKALVLRVLFAIPLIATLIKQIELTRFSRSMSLLLASGVPIASALELSEEVLNTRDLSRSLKKAREMVISGKKFSEGLKLSKKGFPRMMIKIIEAGERTGLLDKSMQEVADNLDYQVSNTLKTVTVMIEPIMLVFVGVLVGGMMMAIIAPIYGLIGQVGAR